MALHKRFSQLRLMAPDGPAVADFYQEIMGMKARANGFGYDPHQLHILPVVGESPPQGEFYWKVGITVQNLDHAVSWLREQNQTVTEPAQFRDIGYLCYLRDPAGHVIELLQHGFEGEHLPPPEGHAIGAQATLAHITLRVRNQKSAQAWASDQGLRLMSAQPVSDYGFTLYFYSWSDEQPPKDDLYSVSNRPWLWRRPYALLELQHLHGDGPVPSPSPQLLGLAAQSDGVLVDLPLGKLNC